MPIGPANATAGSEFELLLCTGVTTGARETAPDDEILRGPAGKICGLVTAWEA